METVEFQIAEDFMQPLYDRFEAFMSGLTKPCIIVIDIESYGGHVHILEAMEVIIKAKKAEGYIFYTNVDDFAYSCGLFLFMLGDVRLASDTADFFFHAAGFEVKQRVTSKDAREMLEVLEQADIVGDRIIAENTNLSPEMISILKKNKNYLDKEDLIYLGIMEREYQLN